LKLGVTDTLRKLHVTEGDTVKRGAPLVTFADNRTFYAPFDGIVTSLPFDEGETVFPQVPVLSLIDMRRPYVVVTLEQNAAIRVRKDMEALLSFESLRGQRLTGKVTSVYPKEGQFFLNIEVAELPPGLLAGMTADVAVQVAVRKGILQVPLAAVDKGKIRVAKDGAKRTLPVKLGATDGLWAEVLEGDVKPGDKLVVNSEKR
jgi:multidrug efflux pump subunit AcrA (membrane-fusion protein)